jgi:tRNA pseudouridine38-40 synthase
MAQMHHRVKLEVAYHGRPFHGWQRQRDQPTVQGNLETALTTLFRGHRVAVVGAGRTDAGVHAAGQVAHFDPPGAIPPGALVNALNVRLPPEIRVLSARTVAASFHARKSALGKLYTYRGRWREAKLPWSEPRSATVRKIADRAAFSAALDLLAGRHDWASFTVPHPATDSTTRTLFSLRLCHRRGGFDLDFVGEGFLRYQVRRMVGALLEVGSGERGLDDFENLIEHPQPGANIRTAPATGLCLEHVYYRACPAVALGQSAPPTKALW